MPKTMAEQFQVDFDSGYATEPDHANVTKHDADIACDYWYFTDGSGCVVDTTETPTGCHVIDMAAGMDAHL